MLLSELFCYAVLAITVTATCVAGEAPCQEVTDTNVVRRHKRDTDVIIETFPQASYRSKQEIIYQRVSKPRYRKLKPKYGPPKPKYGPPRPKYASSHKTRKPLKKHRRKQVRPLKHNKHGYKSKYVPGKKPHYFPPPQHVEPQPNPKPYYPEPAGFGEPPKDYSQEYIKPPKQSYGEPPVDSYGAPLKPNNIYTTARAVAETANYDNYDPYQPHQNYQQGLDNVNSHSYNHPTYTKPEIGSIDDEDFPRFKDLSLDSYADVYKSSPFRDHSYHSEQRPKHHFIHHFKKNRPWKPGFNNDLNDDQIMVGGQYAEPPGRLVPSFQPSAPVDPEGEDFGSPYSIVDSEVAASASISPYVNYKNSNMAFSPQNLNDAFSL